MPNQSFLPLFYSGVHYIQAEYLIFNVFPYIGLAHQDYLHCSLGMVSEKSLLTVYNLELDICMTYRDFQ